MAVHAVLGTHGQPLQVPAAHERLPGLRLGVAAVGTRGLGESRELGGRGDITDEDPAGRERVGDDVEALPGGEHVEDDPVDRAVGHGERQRADEVADRDGPRGVGPAEEVLDVAAGDLREFGAALEGVHVPVVTDGPQQRHAQRAGADTRLDDPGAREDVGHRDDLSGILGIDDRRAPRHRHHVVREQRPQREVFDPGGVGHRRAVRAADEVVVAQAAAVGEELPAGFEGDRVHPTLGVGQLDAFADGEGAAAAMRAGGVEVFAGGDSHDPASLDPCCGALVTTPGATAAPPPQRSGRSSPRPEHPTATRQGRPGAAAAPVARRARRRPAAGRRCLAAARAPSRRA